MIDNQNFGDHTSDLGAKIVFHQRQRKIDSGAHAGRCPYWSIDRKDAIFLDGDLRVATLHISREVPMGGCSSTVEQSCLRENERAGTDRSYPSASMNSGSKIFQQPWRRCRGCDAARDEKGVERAAFERRRLNVRSQRGGNRAA